MRQVSTLVLLLLALLPAAAALPPCFANGTDTGLDIRGSWVDAPELLASPNAMATVRCRTEGTGARGCLDHTAGGKRPLVALAGGKARRFVAESCALDASHGDARAHGLAEAIGPHRTVFVLGDSLLMQHKSTLRCELEAAGLLVNGSAGVGRVLQLRDAARLAFFRVSHLDHLKKQLHALAHDPGGAKPSRPSHPPRSAVMRSCRRATALRPRMDDNQPSPRAVAFNCL
jgi:hypothetical protein